MTLSLSREAQLTMGYAFGAIFLVLLCASVADWYIERGKRQRIKTVDRVQLPRATWRANRRR